MQSGSYYYIMQMLTASRGKVLASGIETPESYLISQMSTLSATPDKNQTIVGIEAQEIEKHQRRIPRLLVWDSVQCLYSQNRGTESAMISYRT